MRYHGFFVELFTYLTRKKWPKQLDGIRTRHLKGPAFLFIIQALEI